MRLAIAVIFITNPAWGACLPGEQTFMTCQIEGSSKSLRVCFNAHTAYYRFGALDERPELELKESIETVSYTLWPGVGRSIWEAVQFENLDYSYEVHGGFERMFDDEEYEDVPHRSFGGVRVTQGETVVQELSCARETVDFTWDVTLGEAKNDLGYAWSFEANEWIALPD
ncbi:hypothetical protein Q4555_03970 [Octadecabacter sp. 1_MG-2023]|uniref:hypothetical protein n=1 Tax=unclassified Octadecabacter TaxID=196158 RepID=UPI001C0990ED|nr:MULTISPECIES: hypothetical protein [unclassified Octadecabacter]MBU2992739.1 hypothetical protein [Octadecabacter sp. B2R22]MDO6733810.1 hypothetical protein [Octadecabacter sp. 1_MG-2023]